MALKTIRLGERTRQVWKIGQYLKKERPCQGLSPVEGGKERSGHGVGGTLE